MIAAQVLSDMVGKILGSSEVRESDQYCMMFDQFFDYCNVRSSQEHIHQ